MLKILMSKDWPALRQQMLSSVSEDVGSCLGRRILMVPELCSHDMERQLAQCAGDTASRYVEVLSFTRLARRVSEYTRTPIPQCLDNGGRVVAMAAAARALSSRLKAYASVETKPDFLEGILDAVDEFKRCCITSKDLAFAAGQTEGSLSQKLEELSLLLEAYDSLCAQGKLDPRDQMTWLLDCLENSDFAENHVFYIDGFPDYTRQHMAILEHLIRCSPLVTVGLNTDYVASHALAFEKAGDTASQIIACAKRAGVQYEIEVLPGRQDDLADICRGLFQGKTALSEPAGAKLAALRADTVHTEVQCTAEKVMELVRNGCRYRDIAVVCADMGAYRKVLEPQFKRCGIPVYVAGTEDILEKTVISTVLSALDAALGGFDQKDVLRYLKSILSPLDPDTCDTVENYAIMWGIRGNRWHTQWDKHPNGLNEVWTEGAQNALDRLNRARERALTPLKKLHDSFASSDKLSNQVKALYAFLEEIHMPQRIARLAQDMEKGGDNRTAQIMGQLWEILLSALEQMHDVLGDTVWDWEAFQQLLKLLLSQYDVGTIPPVLDAVSVGGISAMRLHSCKHLFVLGANEGSLPGYAGSAGILSDQERNALRSCGLPLTGGSLEGIQAEFAEIYGVFCGATESVTVSCLESQESYVWKRLAAMAVGAEEMTVSLGAALYDPKEAGAYLARFDEKTSAETLGITEWYDEIKSKTEYSLGNISPEQISALYGDYLTLSASQVDRQAQCRMSYFLKYGMRAKERKEATIDPAEFGTYVHWVLENTARQVMEEGGFHSVSLQRTMEIAFSYSEEYMKENFSQIDSSRVQYLFKRNARELQMVVEELWQELKQSKFTPRDFEVGFGEGEKMAPISLPSNSIPAVLRGFVDRVDIWKENGQSYFRVVDYKTGKKSFDYCDVYNGVGLQMLLYMFALEQEGAEVVGDRAVAAGVQYFPARAAIIGTDGYLEPEQADALRKSERVRQGLLLRDEQVISAMEPESMDRLCCSRKKDGSLSGDLADREQLKLLRQYVFKTLGKLIDDIASGNVEPNPYTRGSNHNPCSYCPYGDVCHQATVEGRRNFKTMSADDFWQRIGKEDLDG